MKNILTITLLLFAFLSYGQETTTFILVRHAEKASDGTKDPDLTEAGKERAQRLAEMFSMEEITAVYSTDFKRTKQTVEPLSKTKGLEIQTYEWKSPKALMNTLLEQYNGGTIVISGHSNTTPILANALIGRAIVGTFSEDDYGNILIVTVSKVGTGKLIRLRF